MASMGLVAFGSERIDGGDERMIRARDRHRNFVTPALAVCKTVFSLPVCAALVKNLFFVRATVVRTLQ